MIANCISRLISPTFLLLMCTIFAVSYSKRAERTVSQIPLQDTIFSKFDRDEKWIEWGSLYWSKGARCVSQSPNPNSHEVHEVEQFIPDIVCQPFCVISRVKSFIFTWAKEREDKKNLSSKLDELLDQMQSPDLSRSISKCANVDAIFICHVGQRKKRQLNIWGQCSRKMDFLTGWFSEGTTGSIFSSERNSSEYFWNSVFWGKWDVDEYHFTNRRECFHTKGII